MVVAQSITKSIALRAIRPTDREARLRHQLLKLKRYETYRKYPLLWAHDVLGKSPDNYKWSLHGDAYANHVWDGTENPMSTAWNALARQKWVGVAAATGTSKTYTAAQIVLWFLDCFEDAFVVTSAPKESQLTLNLWGEISKLIPEFRKTRPHTRVTKLRIQPNGLNPNHPFSDTWQAIGFVAGVGADEESATKAQGFHRENMLIICEEAAGMNSAVMTAFKNTCTATNNIILCIGNPDSETDELYKFCQLPNVLSVRISAYDFPNVVLNNEIYPGAVSRLSIDRRRAEYGEGTALFLSRVRGITPNDNENSLIKGSWVDECNVHHPNFKGQKHFTSDGERIIQSYNAVGADIANSENGDMACLAWGRGQFLDEVQEFQCPNATHLAYNLVYSNAELLDRGYSDYNTAKLVDYGINPSCIGIDTVGVGVATFNALYDQPINIEATSLSGGFWDDEGIIPCDAQGKPLFAFNGLRSQMYWALREDIRRGEVVFNIADQSLMARIKKELTMPKFVLSSGSVTIEKKENIVKRLGKSPNIADALAYWNWVRKGYRMKLGDLPVIFG